MITYRAKVKILLGCIAFFALSLVLGAVFSPEAGAARASAGTILPGKSGKAGYPDGIARIDVGGAETYSILKQGDTWAIEADGRSLPVLGSRVDSFLKELALVKRLERVGKLSAAADKLGLGADAKRVSVKRADGSPVAELSVGGYAQAGGAVYVALAGKPDAYLVPGAFAGYLSSGAKSWYDLRLFRDAFPVDSIQRLSVSGSLEYPATEGSKPEAFSANYALERDEKKGWIAVGLDALQLDASAVDRLARSLSGLEAESFGSEAPAAGGVTVTVELGDGSRRTLRVAGTADAEGRFAATVDGIAERYLVASWSLKNLLKYPSQLVVPKN